jgi:hypothetical protein
MVDKVTKKKLKSLQQKWIGSMSDKEKEEEGALTMDFSELEEGKKGKSAPKKKVKGKAEPEAVDVGAEERPVPEVPFGEAMVDYDMIEEIVQRVVNIEVERAIRELKAEIREQSETNKRELFEQLKLEIETLRQEIEFSRPGKSRKGLFERF